MISDPEEENGPMGVVVSATSSLLGGCVAFVLGCAIMGLAKIQEAQDFELEEMLQFLQWMGVEVEIPETYQVLGWIFYRSHNVEIYKDMTGQTHSREVFALAEGGLWEPWFLLVPILTLGLAGFGVASLRGSETMWRGALSGSSLVFGYGSLALVSVFVTTWTTPAGGATLQIGPDPVTAILVVGVVYPISLGGIGGALAGVVADRYSLEFSRL